MKRFFISQHPTFGSFSRPIKWKVEQSPYFYWWLALTLNEDYLRVCDDPSANLHRQSKKLQYVYENFGDVRYKGDSHVAFSKWWNQKLDNGETRGVFLFAEPTTEMKVEVVNDLKLAEQLLEDENELLIRITRGMSRSYIDKALDRIFKKHLEFEKGRQVRSPTRSRARFSLSKPVTIENLQMAFKIYQLIAKEQLEGRSIKSYQLAKCVGLKVQQRAFNEVWDKAEKRRVISVAVSRKKKLATNAIQHVAEGVFP